MAITYEAFINRHGEFERVARATVEACIAAAELEIDEEVWGAKADEGRLSLTAMLLCQHPNAQPARLVPPNAKVGRGEALTTYERRYKSLQRQVASGFRVTGSLVDGASD